uniref:Methionine aminopeptidase n=1 Tax=Angiostrongylus cantonensis TaxID=6313 RepID=A0A0K0DNP2_ANGCA
MADVTVRRCDGFECEKPAKLRCPTCIKLGLKDSFFCDQTCFKANWSTHKNQHTDPDTPYNPWPNYRVLDDEEKEGLRVACRLGREVLDEAAKACVPGVTTDEIDRVVHEACIERNCYPSPLGYYNFPKSCCTSVNEVICHGIPDLRVLENGDLCNVDVTVYHRGFHGDLNETFLVGDKVDEESRRLVSVTYECLQQAISIGKVKYYFCTCVLFGYSASIINLENIFAGVF